MASKQYPRLLQNHVHNDCNCSISSAITYLKVRMYCIFLNPGSKSSKYSQLTLIKISVFKASSHIIFSEFITKKIGLTARPVVVEATRRCLCPAVGLFTRLIKNTEFPIINKETAIKS